MYVWHVHPSFLAVAQANSVEEARAAVLRSDLGESGDGSCPERDKAREFVLTNTPAIWYEVNAEFVLTDSAELREQEDYSQKLFKRVSQLEADLAAAREDVARMDKALRRIATMECHSEGGLPVTPSELREIARDALAAAIRAERGGK